MKLKIPVQNKSIREHKVQQNREKQNLHSVKLEKGTTKAYKIKRQARKKMRGTCKKTNREHMNQIKVITTGGKNNDVLYRRNEDEKTTSN